jgi:predicted  nucleic acid-binding Zn-ribbon protein
MNKPNEITRAERTQDEAEICRQAGLQSARAIQWKGYNWREYQVAIVRQNHHISKLEQERDHEREEYNIVRKQLDQARAEVSHERAMREQALLLLHKAEAQVADLLAAAKGALNDINTSRRHVYTGSTANPDDMTFDAIENTLAVSARDLKAAIAAAEGRQ